MKKVLLIVLALVMLISIVSAEEEFLPVPEPAKAFEGVWQCDRATIELYWEEEGFRALITWGSSAWEHTEWQYSCYYHEEDNTLVAVPFGIRTDIVYGDDGELVSATDIYDDGEAVFSLDADGYLIWQDMKENAGDGMRFVKLPDEPAALSFTTIGEAMASEGYTGIAGSDDQHAVAVVKLDDSYIRLVADLDEKAKELGNAIQEYVDADTLEAAFAAYNAYIETLPISYEKEITAQPKTQEELDTLVGKNLLEVEEAGYESSSSHMGEDDAAIYTVSYGLYEYDLLLNETYTEYMEHNDNGYIGDLTVKSAGFAGLSRNAAELRFHADGTYDAENDPWGEYTALMEMITNAVTSDNPEDAVQALAEAMPDKAEEIKILADAFADAARSMSIGSPAETRIRVFETSDIHGYLLDTSSGNENTFQYRLAYIAQIVNNARASGEYDDVLLLDGGDIYQGMPASNLTNGAAMRAAFDAMDYDAVALGNHEFDWNVTQYCADPDGTLPAYQLGVYSGDPSIPILASNLYYAGTDKRVNFTQDYVVVEKAGLRIAVIGYIADYSMSVMADKIAPYRIESNLNTFAKRVKEINEAEEPDITIVLCHCNPIPVAEALSPEDADLVAGGHKHRGIYGFADSGVPYIQADANAQGYATAIVVVGQDGSVHIEEPVYSEITQDKEDLFDIPENADLLDDTVLAISHAAWSEISDEMSEVLGYIDKPIEKNGFVGDRETSGGNWITRLMLRKTESQGAVAAFFNYKGIRANITISKGQTRHNLTVGDVYSLVPFNNTWLIYELTGQEIAQQLIKGFINTNYGDQVSGLTYEYINHGTEEYPEIEIISVTLNDGTEVDINDTRTLYRVCTSNYNATLDGSVFLGKTPVVPESEAPIDNLTVIELLREEASENDGRIYVDTEPRGIRLEEAVDDAA